MKRATVLFLALLLVPVVQADAKFSSARVCGPSDCREITLASGRSLATIQEAVILPRAKPLSTPPEAAPWYRVTLCTGRCDSPDAASFRVLPADGSEYLPPRQRLARDGWARLGEPVADVYRRVTAGLDPFPASGLLALGATEPTSADGASDQAGTPAWAWIAIAALAATLACLHRNGQVRARPVDSSRGRRGRPLTRSPGTRDCQGPGSWQSEPSSPRSSPGGSSRAGGG